MTNKEMIQNLTDTLTNDIESALEEKMGTPFVALTPAFDKEYRKVVKGIIRQLLREL